MKTKKFKTKSSTGMCPNMTVQQQPKNKKPPAPYKTPVLVKRYYDGVKDGIHILKNSLLKEIEDEEIQDIIKHIAKAELITISRSITENEKKKTKEKMKKWEEEEWESV